MNEKDLTLVNIFFKQIQQIDGMSIVKNQNSAVIIPPKTKYYYMPHIVLKDLESLQRCFEEYIFVVQSVNIRSNQIDQKHDVEYFIGNLIKNLTSHDCNNFEEYIMILTNLIRDNTFSKYDEKTELGSLNEDNRILVRRSQEYYGAETPYVLKTIIKNKHIEYELPLVRYGVYNDINGNKVARIYMVQRKKLYNQSSEITAINKSFSVINSGVKEERNVPPSMIIVLATFFGLLQSEGISKVLVSDLMTRRYGHFQNTNTDEQRNNIQYHATNIFLNLFLRINQHFEGLNIDAFPNDIDSFMHISLDGKLKCNNKMLEQCYLLGYNGGMIDRKDRRR